MMQNVDMMPTGSDLDCLIVRPILRDNFIEAQMLNLQFLLHRLTRPIRNKLPACLPDIYQARKNHLQNC